MQGGPGRPVGSRNRLTEVFLRDLQAQWEQHGKDVLEVIAEDYLVIYFQFSGPSLTSLGRSKGSTHLKKS